MDNQKFEAELKILRELIDFLNRQVGVYCDCLSGFDSNKIRVERQVARINFPTGHVEKNGVTTIVSSSVEDPSHPDIIIHRLIKSNEFVNQNSERGFNERQICWAIVLFTFAFWDEDVRPKIATIRGVKPNEVQVDAFGDLRLLRNCIAHNRGILSASDHKSMKMMGQLCEPAKSFSPSHDQMHKIFIALKNAIGAQILSHVGHLPGAPDATTIVGVAIQNV